MSNRILYVCTGLHTIGGIQRFGHNLVSACRDLGMQVDVLSLSEGATLPACCSGANPPRLFGAGGSKARWVMTLARRLAGERYSAVICGHIHFAPAFASLLAAPWSRPVTSVLVLHGVEVWGRVTAMQRHAANHFTRVLAVSQYTKDSFMDQVSGPVRDRVSVFPNTISPEFADQLPVSRPPNSTAGSLRLLSVARLARSEREKGVLHVLEAMSGLKRDLAIEYSIVGDGDDLGFLKATAADLGLSSCVHFRGALNDAELWDEYRCADAFILPSRKEGFGIVFLEAMRFGLPVIAAAEKGALDVVREGENGFLVPYGDVNTLRQRIEQLAEQPLLRHQLGEGGRSLVGKDGEFGFPAFRSRCSQWLVAS